MRAWWPNFVLQMWDAYPYSPFARKIRQPEVRPPPPVSTKHELSGLHSPPAPKLCQLFAQAPVLCPSKDAPHSPRGCKELICNGDCADATVR